MTLNENKKLVQEINDEFENKKREELKIQVRAYKQSQLEEQERLKSEKEKIEEKLRIIKLNLENLDKGNFEAIEERIKKSEMARQVDPVKQVEKITAIWNEHWPIWQRQVWPHITWTDTESFLGTTGTFQVGNKTFYF